MTEKTFEFIGTYTGVEFTFLDPKPEQVNIEDIANALSNLCRYSGHVKTFYSVAEHSIILSDYIMNKYDNADMAFTALMHDASEAYIVDVPRPIKPYLKGYMEMEDKIQKVISEKFGVTPMKEYPQVLEADTNIVADEASVLFKIEPDWIQYYTKIGITPLGLTPLAAREAFILKFVHLLRATQYKDTYE